MARSGLLDGRVALVTGAGRGLGRAYALMLAREGAAVVVNDLGCSTDYEGGDPSVVAAVVAEIASQGGRAIADPSDIASFAAAAHAVELAIGTFGRLDILINNAGVSGPNDVEGVSEEWYDKLLDVNFKATVATVKAAFPQMKRQRYGRIVNTVTEGVFNPGFGGGVVYSPAKAAVWAATLAMAKAGEECGITANAISPVARTRLAGGAIDRFGQKDLDFAVEPVARAVVYLVSEASADITGRLFYAGAGFVREYAPPARSRTDLAQRLEDRAKTLA
jgi:NAD(P)-dependent dehydrogenase (short-subunit alcohol dehydrogenase family)